MINPRFGVRLYDDLNQELFDLGWFPEYAEQENLSRINGLAAVEVRIGGLEDDNDAWDVSMASLEIAARSILEQVFPTQLLVAVEGGPRPISRVRSYKGFLSRRGRIGEGKLLEKEMTSDAPKYPGRLETNPLHRFTFFVAVAEIVEESWPDCFAEARDWTNVCILSSSDLDRYFSEQMIDRVVTCLDIENVVTIDYMRLIPVFCQQPVAITSIGWDTGGTFVNFSAFAKKEVCHNLFEVAKEYDQQPVPYEDRPKKCTDGSQGPRFSSGLKGEKLKKHHYWKEKPKSKPFQ